MSKIVLFQTIQFSITQSSSVCPIDMTLSDGTTPGQRGPGNDVNEGVLRIPPSWSISETSTSDCFVSYPGHSLGGGILSLSREAVGIFYSPSRLGKILTDTTTPDQSGSGKNDNERIVHRPLDIQIWSFTIWRSLSLNSGHPFFGGGDLPPWKGFSWMLYHS